MKRKAPDADAEAARAGNLSSLNFSRLKPGQFESESKATHLNMRLPTPLLDAAKARAKARGVAYTRFVREVLEQTLVNQPSLER